jgi:pyruvate/2-oxoacid:ferredoxin oxidoreductase alpha subunit
LVKIRLFRPFPTDEVRKTLSNAKKIAVIDRNIGFGVGGIFAQEVKAALYNHTDIPVFSYIAGLGGRDVTPATLHEILNHAVTQEEPGKSHWIGVKNE